MTYIIAEIGVNHNGSLETALEMIKVAKECGADAVKFQTFKADKLVDKSAEMADYQKNNMKSKSNQYELLKSLEFGEEQYLECKKLAGELSIDILSSAFDEESLDFLVETGMDLFKVSSGELTNYPMLKKYAGLSGSVILSTGMADLNEVRGALEYLKSNGAKNIILLHCTTDYPTKMEDVNLNVINTFRTEFSDVKIGYSDHTLGGEVAVAAVTLGAVLIEKHFTLDKGMIGPDHKASMEPGDFKEMVRMIRNVELALGSPDKKPTLTELASKKLVRKSIVAKTDIKKNDIFTVENLTTKRPGTGVSPIHYEELLGKKSNEDYDIGTQIDKKELS